MHSLLDPLPVDRLRGFGGKLGELLRKGRPELGFEGFETAGALRKAGPAAVARVLRGEWSHPEEQGAAACRLASGEDSAGVEDRALAKQVGSSKNFGGNRGSSRGPLDTRVALERWVRELCGDVATRLSEEVEENGRAPTLLVVACRFEDDGFAWNSSRSKRAPLRAADTRAEAAPPLRALADADAASASVTVPSISVEQLTREAMVLLGHLTSGRPATRLAVSLLAITVEGFVPTGAAAAGGQSGALRRLLNGTFVADARRGGAPYLEASDEGVVQKRRLETGGFGTSASHGSHTPSLSAPPSPAWEYEDALSDAACIAAKAASLKVLQRKAGGERSTDSAANEFSTGHGTTQQKLANTNHEATPAIAEWVCQACTLINVPDARRCTVCDAIRGGTLPAAATLAAAAIGRAGLSGSRVGSGRGRGKPEAGSQTGGQALMARFLLRDS